MLGGDLLDHVLERQGLQEHESHMVMVQLLRALRWLHGKRIVHGCAARELRHLLRAGAPRFPS